MDLGSDFAQTSGDAVARNRERGNVYSYEAFVTRDADEQAASLARWEQTYDQITPGRFEGRLVDCWFGDLQLFREITNQTVHEGGKAWPESLTFGIPMSMDGLALFRGRPISIDTILALDARTDELDLLTPRSLDIVAIVAKRSVIGRFCELVEGTKVEAVILGRSLIPCPPECMARLRMVLQSMFEMLRVRHDLLEQPQIRRSLQDGLLANLFSTLGEAGDTTIAECAQGRRRVVERAKAYVLAKQNEPVTVAELCRAIGASRRKLQYCFHEVLGHSPHQYLRAVRLNRVRRELKGEAAGFVSVQQAAANWGFWHLSHFTADYKAMFGELPSDTLRRSRAAAR